MMEPLRKYQSSDVPEFSSYPAEPDRVTAQVVEFGISEFDALPETHPASDYDETGRRIGAALGRLVNSIVGIVTAAGKQVKAQYARVEDDVALTKEAAEHAYEDTTRNLRRLAQHGAREARARAHDLRHKAVEVVDEYPVQTLAAAGIAGIGIGIGLRAWRRNRD